MYPILLQGEVYIALAWSQAHYREDGYIVLAINDCWNNGWKAQLMSITLMLATTKDQRPSCQAGECGSGFYPIWAKFDSNEESAIGS
jgi:hypothetical protein